VLAEADWIKKQPHVRKAMQERGLQVHAFCYDKETNKCSKMVEIDNVSAPVARDPWTHPAQQKARASVS
jgi:carbonic anhydrase